MKPTRLLRFAAHNELKKTNDAKRAGNYITVLVERLNFSQIYQFRVEKLEYVQ